MKIWLPASLHCSRVLLFAFSMLLSIFLLQHSDSILLLSISIAWFSIALWLLLSGIDIEVNKKN